VILYGQVISVPPAPDLSTVSFTVTGDGQSAVTPSPARVVSIEGLSWYLVGIPFETRAIQGTAPLPATANTLELTASETHYTLAAKIGEIPAVVPIGQEGFDHGAGSQGHIRRIDLTLGGETYAQWSQRIFGSLASTTEDADGDGRSNHDEYLAGTDPKDPASRLQVAGFAPSANGFTLTWDTVAGKTYAVERSSSLSLGAWTTLQGDIHGDGTAKSFTDPNPGTAPRLFYRISVLVATAP
jgi:hypothetical protein